VALCQATNLAQSGCERFYVKDERAQRLYARTLVGASLLSAFLKGEERVSLALSAASSSSSSSSPSQPPISRLFAEALHLGEVRGYATGSAVEGQAGPAASCSGWDGSLLDSSSSSSSFAGSCTVTRVLYGAAEPVQSTVSLRAGDVESELQGYFEQSEQRGAVVRLEAETDASTGRLLYAGGILVEEVAQEGGHASRASAGSSTLQSVAAALQGPSSSFSLARLHARGSSLAAAAGLLLPELQQAAVVSAAAAGAGAGSAPAVLPGSQPLLQRTLLDFFCRCSKAKFLAQLVAASPASLLQQMLAEAAALGREAPAAVLQCQFCNASHSVSPAELQAARGSASAGSSRSYMQ
jgi:redox-regulated HSP33 family molecular chaperone